MPRLRGAHAGLFVLVGLLFTLAAGAGAGAATLSAPTFLPGQPMIVGNQVLVIWAPVPGAAGYVVYRNGKPVARVQSNQYLAPLPEAPGSYRFQVAAVDAAGAVGERSQPGVIRVRKIDKPQNLTARPDPITGSIGLVWDRVEGAMIYNVYRAEDGEEPELLASVQGESFVDGDVTPGVTYTYTVTARDIGGEEGPPSDPATATSVRVPRTARKRVVFRAQPTREVFRIESIQDAPVSRVSYLGAGPGDTVWVVTPRTRLIGAFDLDGNLVTTLGPYDFSDTGFALLPHKLAFGPDGKLYVTDAINGVLACIQPDGTLLWARGILTPPPDAEDVWDGFPDRIKRLPPTPSSVACLDDEIWVTDQRFQLLYRFDYQGKLLGYVTHAGRGEARFRLPAVGEVAPIGPARVLLTFPLSHYAVVADRDLRLLAEIGTGDIRGYVGGFVGIHGIQPLEGGRVLLTDPGVGSLQVFDTRTGKYLYHISGPDPRRDPAYGERADLPLRKPNMATLDGRGRIWVYDAAQAAIVVLRPAGPVTPPVEE